MARMPDGRWLAAYGASSKIMLSASADGKAWEKPWELPHGSIFTRVEPALHIDRSGTLWLACFSNRLGWAPPSSSGYRLWLLRSRDGRQWSRPRPILLHASGPREGAFWRDFERLGGWPCGAVQIVEGPRGRHWIFWRNFIGSADSPAGIQALEPIQIDKPDRLRITDPHVAIGPAGRLHMVFAHPANGIYYTTSADGGQWSAPVLVVGDAGGTRAANAQLILDGKQAALIYETLKGAWLRHGALGAPPTFGPPIKITNHTTPLNGARAALAPDGQVALLAGGPTVWLLQADRNTLSRPVHKF
jgi:hypothetical protein